MNPLTTVKQVVIEKAEGEHPISPFLSEVITIFNRSHLYYRTYKFSTVLTQNGADGNSAIYGIGLQNISGWSPTFSVLLNLALIIKCAEDLLGEYRKLGRYQSKLVDALNTTFTTHHSYDKPKITKFTLFSASTITYMNVQVKFFFVRTWTICSLAIQILGQCFVISMCLCDAHLLLQGDVRSRTEACTELVIGWKKYKKDLKNNQGSVLKALKNSQELTDIFLEKFGVSFRMKTILDQFDDAMNLRSQGHLSHFVQAVDLTVKTFYEEDGIVGIRLQIPEDQSPPQVYQHFPSWAGQEIYEVKEKSKN
jgi:hypothetical protein